MGPGVISFLVFFAFLLYLRSPPLYISYSFVLRCYADCFRCFKQHVFSSIHIYIYTYSGLRVGGKITKGGSYGSPSKNILGFEPCTLKPLYIICISSEVCTSFVWSIPLCGLKNHVIFADALKLRLSTLCDTRGQPRDWWGWHGPAARWGVEKDTSEDPMQIQANWSKLLPGSPGWIEVPPPNLPGIFFSTSAGWGVFETFCFVFRSAIEATNQSWTGSAFFRVISYKVYTGRVFTPPVGSSER